MTLGVNKGETAVIVLVMETATAGLVIRGQIYLCLVVIELYDPGKLLYSPSYFVKALPDFQATSHLLRLLCPC